MAPAEGDRVGVVDMAVARQAEPRSVRPAVHHGLHAGAEVALRCGHRVGGNPWHYVMEYVIQ